MNHLEKNNGIRGLYTLATSSIGFSSLGTHSQMLCQKAHVSAVEEREPTRHPFL